jgi:hypothetical protein
MTKAFSHVHKINQVGTQDCQEKCIFCIFLAHKHQIGNFFPTTPFAASCAQKPLGVGLQRAKQSRPETLRMQRKITVMAVVLIIGIAPWAHGGAAGDYFVRSFEEFIRAGKAAVWDGGRRQCGHLFKGEFGAMLKSATSARPSTYCGIVAGTISPILMHAILRKIFKNSKTFNNKWNLKKSAWMSLVAAFGSSAYQPTDPKNCRAQLRRLLQLTIAATTLMIAIEILQGRKLKKAVVNGILTGSAMASSYGTAAAYNALIEDA